VKVIDRRRSTGGAFVAGIIMSVMAACTCSDGRTEGAGSGGTGEGESGSGIDGSETGPPKDVADGGCLEPGPGSSCSVWCQDCPSGQKCVSYHKNQWFDATRCVSVVEDAGSPGAVCHGDSVTGEDDCDARTQCWYANPGQAETGVCTPLCTGSPEEPSCPGSMRCLYSATGVHAAAVCLESCDPRNGSTCEGALLCQPAHPSCTPPACFPIDASGMFFCTNDLPPDYPAGTPCDYTSQCAFDGLCAPADGLDGCPDGSNGCCATYCDLDAPECAGNATCQSVFQPGAAPGTLGSLGVCVSP
jgi:hypothetical protein